jgi:hypothetical protein
MGLRPNGCEAAVNANQNLGAIPGFALAVCIESA